jgi:anaerobic selenocysteine-containing dehydrogenase
VGWEEAFAASARFCARSIRRVVFYSSGRTSLEASYMYGLMARMFGNQNLPDSSNMCHESTSVGLKAAIGVPVGTTRLEGFRKVRRDPVLRPECRVERAAHAARPARRRKRGVEIITFNPLKERGLERFTDPQNPVEMATLSETRSRPNITR